MNERLFRHKTYEAAFVSYAAGTLCELSLPRLPRRILWMGFDCASSVISGYEAWLRFSLEAQPVAEVPVIINTMEAAGNTFGLAMNMANYSATYQTPRSATMFWDNSETTSGKAYTLHPIYLDLDADRVTLAHNMSGLGVLRYHVSVMSMPFSTR